MNRLNDYIEAAERENTRRSYASALRHFEVEWQGLLPATGESVARYLADHGEKLSMNTLRQRLAALSRWHSDHGFPDPTKLLVVRQVLKGIRTLHPAQEKRARPLQLNNLQQVSDWLDRAVELTKNRGDRANSLRHTRNRALLLLGFWRGFRADELVRLRIEHIKVMAGKGMTCYIARSKGDRQAEGRSFQCPALSRLCPVLAYEAWLAESELKTGPVFRSIHRWGQIADDGLAASSIIPLLRHIFASPTLPFRASAYRSAAQAFSTR